MRMKKPAVVLATAALMTLAACGGGSGNSSDSPSSDLTQGAGGNAGSFKNADAKAPVAIPDDAAQGGTFTVLTNQVPSTLDPTQAYYTDSTAILSDLVLRSLTQYAYDADTNDMQLIPDMATDLGRPSQDNKEWTFTLRDGLKYEDGTPVKAEDVKYAIERSFAIAELPDGPTYQTTFFLDGDKYKGPFKDKGAYDGVVVSGNDITIKMRRPFTDMDYYASFPAFTAIPKAKDNPETYGKKPLATGPYKFADYKPGSELKLVKNDQWDPNTDPGRIQAVDGWDFKFGQDTAKLENVIINDQGSAQTTLTYDNVTPSSYRSISSDKGRLVTGTSPCTYMWFIDMTKVKELGVRQALGWAYPYQAAWKAGGEIEGLTRVPGTAIMPPGTAGRVDYQALDGQDGKTTDPAKSKELLKKAGYAPGEYEIKFLFATDDDNAVAAKNEIVKGLEAGGFKATPIASTLETIRTDRTDPKSPINVRSSGWCSDWPTGGSWFPAQWAGSLVGLEGMPNPSQFKEADMDALQDKILDTMTPEEAAKAWGEFDKTMETKYYPAVNTGYSGTAMIHGSKVGGMDNDNVRGMPTFARMYITK
jgi:peptide/nickel transport system substrate-binding protein